MNSSIVGFFWRRERADETEVASGSGIVVGDSFSCGSSIAVKTITWDQCNTIAKMIGFIAGGALNFVHTCMSTLFGRINKVIGLDHIAKYSLELLSKFWNKALDTISYIFQKVRPIFDNTLTRSATHWTIEKLFNPLARAIRAIFRFVFNTVIGDLIIAPMARAIRYLSPERSGSNDPRQGSSFWTSCVEWTITPFFQFLGDILQGGISGALKKKPEEPRKPSTR